MLWGIYSKIYRLNTYCTQEYYLRYSTGRAWFFSFKWALNTSFLTFHDVKPRPSPLISWSAIERHTIFCLLRPVLPSAISYSYKQNKSNSTWHGFSRQFFHRRSAGALLRTIWSGGQLGLCPLLTWFFPIRYRVTCLHLFFSLFDRVVAIVVRFVVPAWLGLGCLAHFANLWEVTSLDVWLRIVF